MFLLKVFSRKWIIPTILVVLGMILLVRLGFWQLDRMAQKQAFNTMAAERWRQEPFDLAANALPADLAELEYRRIQAEGQFDYSHQVLVMNEVYNETAGAMVVTPLVLDSDRAVLVARGWVPFDQADPKFWPQYEEPAGAPVVGLIRKSQGPNAGAVATPPAAPQVQWYRLDIPSIQAQVPYKLEPAFIEQLPEEGRTYGQLPMREEPVPLDEGNHLSYAIQWFTFAVILGFGYLMLVRYNERKAAGLMGVAQIPPDEPVLSSPSGRN